MHGSVYSYHFVFGTVYRVYPASRFTLRFQPPHHHDKVIITYKLTGIYDVNVKGAAIGIVLAYFIAAVLDFIAVMKYTQVRFSIALTYI